MSARAPWAWALAVLSILGSWSCRAPISSRSASARGPAAEADPRDGAAPAWVGQPLSWDKLDAIERWLEEDAHRHDAGLRLEAQLVLCEGRLEYSRKDLEGGSAPSDAVRIRVEAARGGFEDVLRDARASTGQRTRARVGLDGASALLDVPKRSGLALITRSAWGAKPARAADMTPLRGQWSRITVHHSAEVDGGAQGGSLADTCAAVERIQRVHMDRSDPDHGWADIGYHFLIDGSGRIVEGRDLAWQGAHASGDNNLQNIGVCMLGDFSRRAPSSAALKSLELLLDDLRRRFRVQPAKVLVHKELKSTECPGPSLTAWVQRYRRSAQPRP